MKKIALIVISFCSINHVFAQNLTSDQTGWIVGAGMGTTTLSIEPSSESDLASSKENTALFTVFGGYNFTHWFGIEFDISSSSVFKDRNTGLDAKVYGTSFTPKFTYHFDDNLDVYVRAGLQYIAYNQTVNLSYDDEIIWNGVDYLFGAGLQYSFPSGVRARIDYKYSTLTLERSENTAFGFNFYDEEIDLDYKAFTFSVNYQF